jgi:Methyltransferase domain
MDTVESGDNERSPACEPPVLSPHQLHHWKRSEHVVHQILCHIPAPSHEASLPPSPQEKNDWPYRTLPAAARVGGSLPGQIADPVRARAKEDQVRSMLRCILPFVPNDDENSATTTTEYSMVDFGGGTGHLSIPLALLFPRCRVICVDLGHHSLQLLHQKATQCMSPNAELPVMKDHDSNMPQLQTTAIPNLFTFHGPVHKLDDIPFRIAIALHLCGEATDAVLRMPASQNATFIAAPCCVGKLATTSRNPYIFQATGGNRPTIAYPQSRCFRDVLCGDSAEEDWNALAKAADDCSGVYNIAKSLVEADRALFLQEQFGYRTVLRRIEPATATPKRDILVAWLPQHHVAMETAAPSVVNLSPKETIEANNTPSLPNEEVDAIRQQLLTWMNDGATASNERIFPTGMGARRRKVIHQQAEVLGLKHWGVGQKNADKTVVVAKRNGKT